ncbi:hypothetical protein [Sphingomonas arenae]|uniref:hypothetical protein n=1 Tax=Sphingomonas arenae TaxID=2812555 RepID=UPI001968306D|nr:hypothetical protein [Sphingomonas arenae]
MTTAETLFGCGYGAAALLALAAARRRRSDGSREAWAWLLVALALATFALLRFTAIHEDAVAAIRAVARQDGWYEQRKLLQGALLEFLVIAAGVVIVLFALGVHFLRPAILTASTGVALLAMLSLARAMSFHRLDYVLQRQIGPLNLAQYEELVLLLFTGGAALFAATKKGAADDDRAPEISQAEEA